jgi:hypothetical protein
LRRLAAYASSIQHKQAGAVLKPQAEVVLRAAVPERMNEMTAAACRCVGGRLVV